MMYEKKKKREDILADNYRKVEAMYRRGLGVNEIMRAISLSRMDALDIIQKIFAMDQRKAARV